MYEAEFVDDETYYFDSGEPGPTLGRVRKRESPGKGRGARVFTVEQTVSSLTHLGTRLSSLSFIPILVSHFNFSKLVPDGSISNKSSSIG